MGSQRHVGRGHKTVAWRRTLSRVVGTQDPWPYPWAIRHARSQSLRATVRQGNIDGEPNFPGHGDTERNRRSSGSECKQDDPVEVREPGEFRADRARRRLGRRLGGETTEGRRNGRPLPGELAQSACRRFHLAFELCVPAAELTVQAARPQVVADTQDHLLRVERFRQEVGSPACERPRPGVAVDIRGQDQDGQKVVGRDRARNRREHAEAIKTRHVQIEQDDIGWARFDRREGAHPV